MKSSHALGALLVASSLPALASAQTFGPGNVIAASLAGVANAEQVATGDIDGDGDLDVVYVERSSGISTNSVFWQPNDGEGVFGPARPITSNFARADLLGLVDVGGDGDLDVVYGRYNPSSNSPRLAWSENDGSGNFVFEQSLLSSTTARVRAVRFGDFDGDGLDDVVAFGDSTRWFRNDPAMAGLSGPLGLGSTINPFAVDLNVADFDGDGDVDLVTRDSGNSAFLAWYENLGPSGNSAAPILFSNVNLISTSSSSSYSRPTPGDLDGDGDIDLLVNGGWLQNSGTGTFGQLQQIPGFGGNSLELSDLDGDGDLDALAGQSSDRVFWYENRNGGSSWQPHQITLNLQPNTNSATTAVVGDMDGDAEVDVVAFGDRSGAWFRNRTSTDCNNNGVRDLVDLANGTSQDCNENGLPDECEVNSLPPFTAGTEVNAGLLGAPWGIDSLDVDLDGDLDLVVAGRSQSSLYWFENDGTGALSAERLITNAADGVFSVTALDVDGDGDEDLVTAETVADRVGLYENLGGTFAPLAPLDTALDGARCVAFADIDVDGAPDVVAGSLLDDTVAWYRNLGGGAFGPRQTITANADFVLSLATSDLDDDGDIDVISASRDDDSIRVYENLGDGSAWTIRIAATVSEPNFVVAADLTGNLKPDLAFASAGDDSISLLRNLGALAFSSPELISSDLQGVSSVAASDFNQDGQVDLVVTNYGDSGTPSGAVSWFEGLDDFPSVASFGPKRLIGNHLDRAAFVHVARLDPDDLPDVCAVTWAGEQLLTFTNQLLTPQATDCNSNGIPDSCDINAGASDCDSNGELDSCQIAADSTLDLNGNGIFDPCEAIGSTSCSQAVANSTGLPGSLSVLGNEAIFLNNVLLTARQLPANSFGFFLTSETPGFTPNVPNSQGVLCLQGSVGRFVGPGQIQSSGSTGAMLLTINLNAHPTPTGLISIQPGESWYFQLWYRDGVNGQTTSNFTDAVGVTFQ